MGAGRRFLARTTIGAAALAVLVYAVGLVAFGRMVPGPGAEVVTRTPLVLLVVVTVAVSVLYTAACVVAHRAPPSLLVVLVVAFGARLVLLFGSPAPMLEGDPGRTRFDGRLVNLRLNPYEFTPKTLMEEDPDDALLSGPERERLIQARATLARNPEGPQPADVARPDLRPTAPPLALWFATIADGFKPKSTRGYAFLILVGDVIAIYLLLLALRSLGLPLSYVIVYAWCPVLLKEAYVTLALDALVLPALAGLVYCLVSARRLVTAVPIAICAALRPPLLVLLAVFTRRHGLLGLVLAATLLVLPFVPFYSAEVAPASYAEGQVHVWRHFEYNSLLENVLRGSLRDVPFTAHTKLQIAGVSIVEPGQRLDVLLAKLVCLVVVLGVVVFAIIRVRPPAGERYASLADLFMVLVAMLVASPVLQPAHALWLLPILAVRPFGIAWLMLPGLLCISHLTHLAGPDAADLPLAGGKVSFRVIEFGVFGLLVALDLLWFRVLFPNYEQQRAEAAAAAPPAPSAYVDEEPAYDPHADALVEY